MLLQDLAELFWCELYYITTYSMFDIFTCFLRDLMLTTDGTLRAPSLKPPYYLGQNTSKEKYRGL